MRQVVATRTAAVVLRLCPRAVAGLLHYEQNLVDVLAPQEQKELAHLLAVLLQGLHDHAV